MRSKYRSLVMMHSAVYGKDQHSISAQTPHTNTMGVFCSQRPEHHVIDSIMNSPA